MESQSDDDYSPLITNNNDDLTDIFVDDSTQRILIDSEFIEVVYGYKKSFWRSVFIWILSIMACGIPFLLFHWCPTWLLYATCYRCTLKIADRVLVVEIYQKKHKSYYIHLIQSKNLADTSGFSNEGFQGETGDKENYNVENMELSIHLEDGTILNVQKYRYFRHKKCEMVWDAQRGIFAKLDGLERGSMCTELQWAGAQPPTTETRDKLLNIYGLNEIKVPVQTIMALILLEVFNPFYVFQLFTIAVWLAEPYYYYCIAVVLMSTFGVATSVVQTKRNQETLRATVEAHDTVTLYGGNTVDSRFVVPGDVVLLPAAGCHVYFDAVLLSGTCIVNESMLTGESVPVTKTALPRISKVYETREHAAHTLYCGTKVIQTRYYNNEPVKCLVIRTGYNTSKGQLVRSILYPVPADFKFDRDSYKFIFILACIAALGLAYTVVLKAEGMLRGVLAAWSATLSLLRYCLNLSRHSVKVIVPKSHLQGVSGGLAQRMLYRVKTLRRTESGTSENAYRSLTPGDITIKALDIITIVVPPALPAAMTVGRLYAVSRLARARVACLNTRAVNVSGSVDCVCFDKTGTLTEDGLDMWGIVRVTTGVSPPILGQHRDPKSLNDLDDMKLGMATCHGLTLLDGSLAGDPLDLKMFESTGWTLEEPDVPDETKYELLIPTIVKPRKQANINVDDFHLPLEVGIVQQYQFVSRLQRASVATRILGEDVLRLYCKGAPETLRELCQPDTVPHNLNEVLSSYAEKGYRVIALATRVLELTFQQLQKTPREELERELEFLGLVILENRLKPTTTTVIKELKEADINVVMITGDNIHTAVSVAKECGIIGTGERVVTMKLGLTGEVYCESTMHGVPIGKPYPLARRLSASSEDSGRWTGSGSVGGRRGAVDAESGVGCNYRVVMTGDVWQTLRERYASCVPHAVCSGVVFARMTADQKQQLIAEYQALGYYVAMCGDGANDCGALRAAHTGISLSEAESSVAAPFTSRDPDVSCVPRVLREGRAALVTSFGVFKFMVAYSLTEFFSVAFLYYFDSNLTDFQFLYIDVALIVNFAFFFGKTEAYTGSLCATPPLTSLLGIVPLFSLIGQMFLIAVAQYLTYFSLIQFPWYVRHTYEGEEANECWENYAVYAVSMFQYIILAIVFSHGAPYRRSVVTNVQLMISMLIMTALCLYITIAPAEWLANFLQLRMPLDRLMCYAVLVIAFANFIAALFFERFVIQFMMEERRMIPKCIKEKTARKTPHVMIKRHLTDSDYLLNEDLIKYAKETSGGVSDSSFSSVASNSCKK